MAEQKPHLDEGCSSAPGISPGVVFNCEYLLREVYSPYHVDDENGSEFSERAITVTELRETGFSVHRRTYVGLECVNGLISRRLALRGEDKKWKSAGVVKLQAGDVRELRLDGEPHEQVLVVVDSGTCSTPWHASIFAKQVGASRSHCRELRDLLLPLLQRNLMSTEEAYGKGKSGSSGKPCWTPLLKIWPNLRCWLDRAAHWRRAVYSKLRKLHS